MGMGKDTIKIKGCKLLLDVFQFVGISRCYRIPSKSGVFKLGSD
jgi:hypothetical protein